MSPAQDLLSRANELQLDGKYNEAIELYKTSINLSPSAEAHTYLAWALSSLQKYEEAIEECYKAIGLDNNYWPAYNDMGTNMYNLGRIAEAVLWFERGIELTPDDLRYIGYYNLGKTLEKKNAWLEALKYYVDSLVINPDYELSKKAIIKMNTFLN